MAVYASCKFPFVNEWKELGDRNSFVGFVDSVLASFGQIAFSDNPVCGLLLIIGAFIGSPIQAISGVWAACIAVLFATFIGTPKLTMRLGLSGFNAALAGLGLPLFAYSNNWTLIHILAYSALGAVLCVLLTASLSEILLKRDVPALALPYCITLFILIPASLFLSGIKPEPALIPYLMSPSELVPITLSMGEFLTAMLTGVSEIIWQANIVSGLFYLLAVLTSSRIDFVSAVIGVIIGTATAIVFALPKDGIMIGLYGYNAVLIYQALFGRGYRINFTNFVVTSLLAMISVILTATLTVIFAPIGAPVAAFPYSIIVILMMLSRNTFTKMKFVSPLKWGVPETIAQEVDTE